MVELLARERPLRIQLFHRDGLLFEIRSEEINSEIVIGRSAECCWRIPQDDAVVGSKHATLVREKNLTFLVDNQSKNGTWIQGRRLQKRQLQPGDQLSFGHCMIKVELDHETSQSKRIAEIRIESGKQRNKRKTILAKRFLIGTDPCADLVLTDDLVSRNHVAILRKDEDSYWLKDLQSTNGTRVNECPLRADQERLLKDGDRISVAGVELLFRDGTGQPSTEPLVKCGVMVAVVVIVIGAYFGWQRLVKSSAEDCLGKAEKCLQAKQFAEARDQLDAAVSRRAYKLVEMKAEQLRNRIGFCEQAWSNWRQITNELGKQEWTNAATRLGNISSLSPEAWAWQGGSETRNLVELLKSCLDASLDAAEADRIPLEALTNRSLALASAMVKLERHKGFDSLTQFARQRETALNRVLKSHEELRKALQFLQRASDESSRTNFEFAAKNIETLLDSTSGGVRTKLQMILPPLNRLVATFRQLTNAVDLARDMRFQEALSLRGELPTLEQCGSIAELLRVRQNLDHRWGNFSNQVREVAIRMQNLTNRLATCTAPPQVLLYWSNQTSSGKIFACDSLALPYKKPPRTEVLGEYDQALGIEWFYSYLRSLAGSSGTPERPPYATRLMETREAIEAAKSIVDFLAANQVNNAWLRGKPGQVSQWYEAARRALTLRDQIVQDLMDRIKSTSGRQVVIAMGIACYLMEEPDKTLLEKLGNEFRSLRDSIAKLDEERERANAERKIELRRTILDKGLPGDPTVKAAWQEETEARQ